MKWTRSGSASLLCVLLSLPLSTRLEAQPQASQGKHYIIGIDRSASRSAQQMEDMRRFLVVLLDQLDFGDHVSIVEVMQDGSDQVREYRDSIPSLRNSGRPSTRERMLKDAMRQSFLTAAKRFADTSGVRSVQSTDLLRFVQRVSDYKDSDPARLPTMIILSDMLHSTASMAFERESSIPSDDWIRRRAAAGLMPDLRGVCVVAVGVDAGTRRAVRVRGFWDMYFRTAGAVLRPENYRATMSAARFQC